MVYFSLPPPIPSTKLYSVFKILPNPIGKVGIYIETIFESPNRIQWDILINLSGIQLYTDWVNFHFYKYIRPEWNNIWYLKVYSQLDDILPPCNNRVNI
jgi:hypothetical protein